uniref:Uncharacterized protein n=1 Tax=uncultured marine virus TaxID=186617 RepID=A0A0F7LBG5_9VIRU|nr:hypothetical protein [uncultured marine virus]
MGIRGVIFDDGNSARGLNNGSFRYNICTISLDKVKPISRDKSVGYYYVFGSIISFLWLKTCCVSDCCRSAILKKTFHSGSTVVEVLFNFFSIIRI